MPMSAAALQKLREERMEAFTAVRTICDTAEARKENPGELTAEETGQFEKLNATLDSLEARIAREEKLQERAAWEGESRGTLTDPGQPGDDHPGETRNDIREAPEYRGHRLDSSETRRHAAYERGFRNYVVNGMSAVGGPEESRALAAGIDSEGGVLVPMQFLSQLLAAKDDAVFLRQAATVYPVPGGEGLGVPTLAADPADSDWTSEILTGSLDSTMAFGKRELRPHPLAKRIKVSRKLLRSAVLSPEAIVIERLRHKFAVTEEKAFLTGSGAQQPLGVFTASADGISTDRDAVTGNTTTAITYLGLVEAQFSVKQQYQEGCQWLFHRDAMKMIRKLVDGDSRPLWEPSMQLGKPSLILGKPYMMSEYVPNTFTAALYVGMYGDFSYYWIADSLDFDLQRLVELYAETNQVGFIGRAETDGMPVLEEAFARVKLAAS